MAQKGINKQTNLGNLGNDLEIRYTATGDCVANLSVATSDYWKENSSQPSAGARYLNLK